MLTKLWRRFTGYAGPRHFYEPGGYREIWQIAWPLVILNASNTIMLLMNRVFLAKSSPEEIAASMPAGQMYFTLMAFFMITTSFTATLVAQYHGAGDRNGCVRAAWNGFYFGAAVAALLAIVLPFGGSWIIAHNRHSIAIAAHEADYFRAMVPAAGFVCMELPFLSFFTGRGQTALVAAVKIAGCLVSVPLNYIFIFGKLGLPPLGIMGGGLANSCAGLVTLMIAASVFLFVRQSEYRTRRGNRLIHWELIKKLLFFGAPAGFQTFLRNAAFAVVVMMVGVLGDEALAATSIALTINMIGNMPMIGLMDATSIISAQYIGKRRLLVAERIPWRAWRMLFLWMAAVSVLYLAAPRLLINIFSSGDTAGSAIRFDVVSRYTIIILHWAVLFNFIDGARFILLGALRGAGDTRIPLLICIGTSWLILLPGCVYLILYLQCSISAVWALITFYMMADFLLMYWRRQTGAWRAIKVIDLPPAPAEAEELPSS